jgi:tryptophan-rich sensory protein
MKKWNVRNLLVSIIVCQAAGLIGSLFTFAAIPTWYASLVKPSFSPPNWLFGPVWTTLYIFMGVAMYLVWQKKAAVNLFLIHLVFNAGWSIVFFGLQSMLGGMVALLILWGFIIFLIREFYRIDRRAAYLLIPYLVWVSFAGVLNFSLLLLNQ